MKRIACNAARAMSIAVALIAISVGWPQWLQYALCIVSSLVWFVSAAVEEW